MNEVETLFGIFRTHMEHNHQLAVFACRPEIKSRAICIGITRTISTIRVQYRCIDLDLGREVGAASAGLNSARLIGTEHVRLNTSVQTNCRA